MIEGVIPQVPVATYRLQFSAAFTFADATEVVPYLARLGISHVYASPFLKARPASAHGYDIVDHNELNPELGARAAFDRFCAVLRSHGMGLILDFVPNHVGIGPGDNPWWQDVLEWGQASPYSGYFDIDWTPPRSALAGKLLLPILGQPYGSALVGGEIALEFDASAGSLAFRCHDHRLPLAPEQYRTVLEPALPMLEASDCGAVAASLARLRQPPACETSRSSLRQAAVALKAALVRLADDPARLRRIEDAVARWRGRAGDVASFSPLHGLLEQQHYRLAHWRTAADEINYRRFFDIDDLAAIRMEEEAVFTTTHRLVGQLFAEGRLQGLRIDHVDGLADPGDYCRRLDAFLSARMPKSADGSTAKPIILVEKILAHHERLSRDWPVTGSTGYDFMAEVNGLFVDPAGVERLQQGWRRYQDDQASLADEIHACKRLIIDNVLASELAMLTNLLMQVSEADWFTRDLTRQRLRLAIAELAAAFPVYRTYVAEGRVAEADLRDLAWASEQAKRRWIGPDVEVLDFVRSVLSLEIERSRPALFHAARASVLRFITRFQQYTSAVTAKAIEDTLFYRHLPLASLNEVGADLRRPTTSIEAFHHAGGERARYWPEALLASETHDTKRSEDVRARLNVLSEFPREWERRVMRWRLLNRTRRTIVDDCIAPSPRDEYLLYQTIVGSWPLEITGMNTARRQLPAYLDRVRAYAVKAAREAKLVTSWAAPNERYEAALAGFVDGIFANPARNPFLSSVLRFAGRMAHLGSWNGLAQVMLKATMPGVPDFYCGSELWDLHLVDPDNRGPIDFARRRQLLEEMEKVDFEQARGQWRDGRLKLRVIRAILQLRGEWPALFGEGAYEPLKIEGANAACAIAFRRRWRDTEILVCVARLVAQKLAGDLGAYWRADALFHDTVLREIRDGAYREILSGRVAETRDGGLPLDRVLAALPVAILRPL